MVILNIWLTWLFGSPWASVQKANSSDTEMLILDSVFKFLQIGWHWFLVICSFFLILDGSVPPSTSLCKIIMNGSEVVLWIPMLRNDLDNSFTCIKRLFNWLSCIQWHFLSGMDTLAGEAVLFKCFASLLRDIVSLRRSKLIGRSFQSRLPFIKWFGVQKSKQAV